MAIIITNRAKQSIRGLYFQSTRNSINRRYETLSLITSLEQTMLSTPLKVTTTRRGVLIDWESKGYTIVETTFCFTRRTNTVIQKRQNTKKTIARKWYFACVYDVSRGDVYIADAVFAKYVERQRIALPMAVNFLSAMRGVITRREKQNAKEKELLLPLKEYKQIKYRISESILRQIIRESIYRVLHI